MDFNIAAEAFIKKAPFIPELAIVLGSGLENLGKCEEAKKGTIINFTEIPGFPEQTVKGHSGRLIFCELEGKKILLQAGRFHFYEGNSLSICTMPMRLYGRLGIKAVLHTNAAGAINWNYKIGDFMIICDHINFMGFNPLIGLNVEPGPRFLDMTEAYDMELRLQLHAAAVSCGQLLQEGVYLAVSGPSFETPAEIRAFRSLGADAVGMSTVPEAIVARHEGMKVAGISCICNSAAGMSTENLTHNEVLEAGKAASVRFQELVRAFVKKFKVTRN